MHRALAQVDPVSAERLKPTDRQRLQRALEVYRVTGRPLSAFHEEHHTTVTQNRDGLSEFSALPWPVYSAALLPQDRAWLHDMIAQRFLQMLEQGLVEEVQALRQRPGVHRDLPAMKAVGLPGWPA